MAPDQSHHQFSSALYYASINPEAKIDMLLLLLQGLERAVRYSGLCPGAENPGAMLWPLIFSPALGKSQNLVSNGAVITKGEIEGVFQLQP